MNAKKHTQQTEPAKHQHSGKRSDRARPPKPGPGQQLVVDRGANFAWRQAPATERDRLLAALRAKGTVEHSAAADVLNPNAESARRVALGWRVLPRDRRQAVVSELASGASAAHLAAGAVLEVTSIAGFSAVPEWLEATLATLQAIHDGLDPTEAHDVLLRAWPEAPARPADLEAAARLVIPVLEALVLPDPSPSSGGRQRGQLFYQQRMLVLQDPPLADESHWRDMRARLPSLAKELNGGEAAKKRRILEHADEILRTMRKSLPRADAADPVVDGECLTWCLALTELVLAREDRRFGTIGRADLRDKLEEAQRHRWGPAQLACELSKLAGLGDKYTLAAFKQAATRTRRGSAPKAKE
jgi:hypothetical protein